MKLDGMEAMAWSAAGVAQTRSADSSQAAGVGMGGGSADGLGQGRRANPMPGGVGRGAPATVPGMRADGKVQRQGTQAAPDYLFGSQSGSYLADDSVQDSGSEKMISEALEKANRILSGSDRKFEVTFHDKTKEVMVRVVDTVTNETIREVPPKKIVDIVVSLCELAGIMYDKKG